MNYDVVIVGAGAAGLSAGIALVRSRRSVLIVDAGEPRNAPADGVHNHLGHEGIPARQLLAIGRADFEGYGGTFRSCVVTETRAIPGGFEVGLADGSRFTARRLIITTGLVDELPDIPGLQQRWGRDVLHCPYCHGWEVRDQAIGVLATSPQFMHHVLLFRQLSKDVTVFLHKADLAGDERTQLAARGIKLVEGEVVGIEVTDDRLAGVRLRSGDVVACQALAVQPVFKPRNELDVPGAMLAGNAADPMATVGKAAADGVAAGAGINYELAQEDTDRAVAQYTMARLEAGLTELVMGDRRHGLVNG
ncbi:MAG: NAD(P)/FAD-dependent oxidoreductase [Kibdelosporangium sp.]